MLEYSFFFNVKNKFHYSLELEADSVSQESEYGSSPKRAQDMCKWGGGGGYVTDTSN